MKRTKSESIDYGPECDADGWKPGQRELEEAIREEQSRRPSAQIIAFAALRTVRDRRH